MKGEKGSMNYLRSKLLQNGNPMPKIIKEEKLKRDERIAQSRLKIDQFIEESKNNSK
jgi:hypothetical protein